MGNTRYQAIVKALQPFDNNVLHLSNLKLLIKKFIATKEPAVIEILRTMQEMELIKEESAFKYRITMPKNE